MKEASMGKKSFLILLLISSTLMSSCSGYKVPQFDYNQDLIVRGLLRRTELFYSSLNSGRYDQVEQMAGPIIKSSFKAENLKNIFDNSVIYSNSRVIDAIFEPFAITRANVFYSLKNELPFYICEKMIWQYIDDDWYFKATRIDCRLELRRESLQ